MKESNRTGTRWGSPAASSDSEDHWRESRVLCRIAYKKAGEQLLVRFEMWTPEHADPDDPASLDSLESRDALVHTYDGNHVYIKYPRSDESLRRMSFIGYPIGEFSVPRDFLFPPFMTAGLCSTLLYTDSGQGRLRVHSQQVREIDDDLIEVVMSNQLGEVAYSTLSSKLDHRCLQSITHFILLRKPALFSEGKLMSVEGPPRVKVIYSDYEQVSGIWYPMRIVEEIASMDDELLRKSFQLVSQLDLRNELRILNCELNPILEEDEFRLMEDDMSSLEVYPMQESGFFRSNPFPSSAKP